LIGAAENRFAVEGTKNRAVELFDLLCEQLFKKGDVAQRVWMN
jgi:hypothetical protein